jgi:hypothetical protein
MTTPSPLMHPAPQNTGFFRQAALALSPPWLNGPWGARLMYMFGIQLDGLAEYLRLGVRQRFPTVARSEALRYIGTDRKIIRGFRETDAGYAERLRKAFPTWKFAGNAQTVLRQLSAYFAPNPPVIRYVVNGRPDGPGSEFADWWTIDAAGDITHYRASPNNWNWDDQWGKIRFWIIIYRIEGFTPWYWGDGHYWGGGQSWGFEENFTDNFGVDARNVIGQWKAAGSHAWAPAGIIVTGNTALFDPTGSGAGYPDGTWGTYANRAGIPSTFYLTGI